MDTVIKIKTNVFVHLHRFGGETIVRKLNVLMAEQMKIKPSVIVVVLDGQDFTVIKEIAGKILKNISTVNVNVKMTGMEIHARHTVTAKVGSPYPIL